MLKISRQFSSMLNRTKLISFDVDLLIKMKTFNDRKQFKQALVLFDQLKHPSTDMIINQALKACTKLNDLQRGMEIHQRLSQNSFRNPFIQASLINLYMQCGDPVNGEKIFSESKDKTVSMYGAMLKGFLTNNLPGKALDLYRMMPIEPDEVIYMILFNACARVGDADAFQLGKKIFSNVPTVYLNNIALLNSALGMFIKSGDVSFAENVFHRMSVKTVITYGTMMKGYNNDYTPLKTLALFQQMKQQAIAADEITFTLLINACSQIGMLSICRNIVKQMPDCFHKNHRIQNGLINMWGKSGSIDEAKQIFRTILHPTTVTYNTMIHSYGLNGMGSNAIEIFHQLPSKMIDECSYVAVLNACSHSGLVEEARSIFNNIQMKTEKIYTTMIDVLSRMFLFDEAQKIVDKFERTHSSYIPMYMAMLSASRNQRNMILSKKLFDRITYLFPDQKVYLASASILLANTYAALGDFEQMSKIRFNMQQLSLNVRPGVSWTEVNGQIEEFRANDKSHPRSSEIYAALSRLSTILIQHGHKYDSSWITRPIVNIESTLCGHSEKLAIAFNLIQEVIPSPIQFTKNLRVCGDCHEVTKLIAQIYKREIIVRDANRIHHFHPNGQCSCRNHY